MTVVTTAGTTIAGPDPLEGLRLIDCDAHFTEPADLWTSRAPASQRDRVPVLRTVDGRTAWYLDGEIWASTGGNTIRTGREKVRGAHMLEPFEDIDPAAWDPKARVALLDELGIHAQVLYPNGIGFASNHVFAIEDDADRAMILAIYNDFLVDVQVESNERLLPQALLPIWDMDFTVREMTRLIDAGIRGFTLSDRPELLGLPELLDPYYDPMWDLFDDTRSVANFHIASGRTRHEIESGRAKTFLSPEERAQRDRAPADSALPYWRALPPKRRTAVIATQLGMSNVRVVANLCMSNLFDRFPNLKVVSAESGIGWVPFLLESLEYLFDELITAPDEISWAQRRPTEYFRDHISVTFWFERSGPRHLIEDIGVGNVLIETDIPHPTCLYPGPREHFAAVLADLSPEVRRAVVQDNAAALYRLELPAT